NAPPMGKHRRKDPPRARLSAARCESPVVPLIQQVQNRILVQPQIFGARLGPVAQPLAKLRCQRLEALDNAPDIGPRPLRLLDRKTPHRLAFHELRAKRRPLAFSTLAKKRHSQEPPRYG